MNYLITVVGIISAMSFSGCTSLQLKQSTLAQGQTLTDLEYTMVLDNVAMIRQMPDALPWHLKLTQGSVTINDQVTPSFTYTWGNQLSRALGLTAQRGWQESWTVVPDLDPGDMSKLIDLYNGNVPKVPSPVKAAWIHDGLPPVGSVSGHYGTRIVWVGTSDIGKLTKLVQAVLLAAPVTASDKGLTLPGPVPNVSGR